MKNSIIKPYKKDFSYSYTSGTYATIELLKALPGKVGTIFIHSAFNGSRELETLCLKNKVPVVFDDRPFQRVNQKENSYVLGLFEKYSMRLSSEKPHLVLVNPSDMGNLGTVIRTMAGFGISNLAIIEPAADFWNPKTVRASMGSLFSVNVQEYDSFESYRAEHGSHAVFPFMLDGKLVLKTDNCPKEKLFSLVFGNEATGLPAHFHGAGQSVKLFQSRSIDSFNLAIAAGIGMFIFADTNGIL